MAIIFDPVSKIIQLDSFNVSSREIYTAFVDWASLDDNLKYGEGITQVGGIAPIALYVFLTLDWKVRPIEADGITTISGNLLTSSGESPIAQTLGNWNVQVNLETPLQAIAIQVPSSNGLTDAQAANISLIPALF